jgi:hypothetical protein
MLGRTGYSLSASGGAGSSSKRDLRARSAVRNSFPSKVAGRRTTFVLTLQSTSGDGIRAVRWLKIAKRSLGLRCLDCREGER